MADQLAFAALSGDYNPMHVDAIVARRLIHGRPIVHGIHLLLWALDGWLAESDGPIALREVMLVLKSPVGIDEPVARSETRTIEDGVELELRVDDSECALIRLKWAGPRHHAEAVVADGFPACTKPEPSIVDKIRAATGSLDLCLAQESCRGLFPNVMKRMPASQTAVLLATARLVGMSCPGLDSLYSELQMAFGGDARQPPQLRYAVKAYHDRLGLVAMDVWGPGSRGRVKAFLRPPPRQQASYGDLRTL